ncbi:hypothetical protein [Flavobacterium sp. N2270]|uniref:hypothetical protein n=1 Tax=Flavobacterium sp. N2270 TaxID=2986831 RepID=UPI002223EE56|nr:hypothetical protein [Flavobacterium sp. N2270]
MKHLLIIVLTIFQFSFAYSQPPGGGGGQRGGGQRGGQSGQNKPPQQNNEKKAIEIININDAAGLITYDIDEVIKESKVKKTAEKGLMTQLIAEYNKEIGKIEKANKIKLETIELTSREKQQAAIEKNDHKKLMEIGKNINEELHPIRMEVMEAEKVLNTKIEKSFSEKINKKWSQYFEKQKEANQPKLPKEDENKPDFDANRNNPMQ